MWENNSFCYLFLCYISILNYENGNKIGGRVMFSFFEEISFLNYGPHDMPAADFEGKELFI